MATYGRGDIPTARRSMEPEIGRGRLNGDATRTSEANAGPFVLARSPAQQRGPNSARTGKCRAATVVAHGPPDRASLSRGLRRSRRPLRRSLLRGRHDDAHLLPADLPGAATATRSPPLLPLRSRGRGRRLSTVPTLSPRSGTRQRGLERQRGDRRARAALDRRRRARSRRRRCARRTAGTRRAPAPPALRVSSRCIAARTTRERRRLDRARELLVGATRR